MKRHIIFYILAGVFAIGCIYCSLGVVMSMWLSATPDYSVEAAKLSSIKWGIGALVLLGLCILLLPQAKKDKKSKS